MYGRLSRHSTVTYHAETKFRNDRNALIRPRCGTTVTHHEL